MDQNEQQQMLQSPTKSHKYYQFLKKTLQFLVPVSILSFLLSYTSSFPFLFAYNFHISTSVFPLFTRTIERKYMFILCNGILAFLSKNSSFSCFDNNGGYVKGAEDDVKPANELSEMKNVPALEDNEAAMESITASPVHPAIAEKEEENEPLNSQVKERESGALIVEGEEDEGEAEDDESEESGPLVVASPVKEGNDVNVNIDELNKKFEEFIRKMKEEIRIEAQQQLIAV
ncbi:unnamed protein product [Ilex paraguariensis]|uniref:Uncharacterized protein n=1 Tax=Ilex paraguariensis TaxID=185542 RepID=A0ABC8UMH1_9AQUA